MCISTLLQISKPLLPISSSKKLNLLAWPWYWTTFSSCSAAHVIESNTRKVPLWLSFLIFCITWLTGPPGSDQRSTFQKNIMNVKFPVREKPLQPWLKSLKSNDYYTHNKKMHLIFVWVCLLSVSTHCFFCSCPRTKSILPPNICLHPGNAKKWPVLLAFFPISQIGGDPGDFLMCCPFCYQICDFTSDTCWSTCCLIAPSWTANLPMTWP